VKPSSVPSKGPRRGPARWCRIQVNASGKKEPLLSASNPSQPGKHIRWGANPLMGWYYNAGIVLIFIITITHHSAVYYHYYRTTVLWVDELSLKPIHEVDSITCRLHKYSKAFTVTELHRLYSNSVEATTYSGAGLCLRLTCG
jgi:hypothetical protein